MHVDLVSCFCKRKRPDRSLPAEQRIQFISTKGPFSCLRYISVRIHFNYVSSLKLNLVVSYVGTGGIEIMGTSGSATNLMTTDANGRWMFTTPRHITVGKGKGRRCDICV